MASRRSADLPEVYTPTLPEVAPSDTTHGAVSTLPEVVNTPNTDYAYVDGAPPDGKLEKGYVAPEAATAAGAGAAGAAVAERRICGLKRKVFFGVIIAAIIIVAAAVGGAVGGTVGKKKSSSNSDSSSSSDSDSSSGNTTDTSANWTSVSSSSNLASVNYTDSSGYTHYYVFYQHPNNSIIGSFWDSQNKTWEARSLTASLEKNSVDLSVGSGAPLTALAWSDSDNDWNLKVYVLTATGRISELDASDITVDTQWSLDSQISSTGEASNIAAWRPNGGNSSYPPSAIIGQSNQRITYTNEEGQWTELQSGTSSSGITAVNGTGLGLTTICSYCGDDRFEWKFYFHANSLQEYSVKNDLSSVLADNALDTISSDAENANFAAINFNTTSLYVINIDDSNSLKARWWNNEVWSSGGTPTLNNSPDGISATSNFTAIAANADRRVYGLIDGTIYEWQFSESTPQQWTFKGKVDTEL